MRQALRRLPPVEGRSPDQAPEQVHSLLRQNRPEAAVRLLEAAESGRPVSWTWTFADQAAGLFMHLGRPEDARRVWQQARACPSEALRQCRVACTFWAEQDFPAALHYYQGAAAADPDLAEAWWALAMLHLQQGDPNDALRACRQGLQLSLNERQHADLEALQRFLVPYCRSE